MLEEAEYKIEAKEMVGGICAMLYDIIDTGAKFILDELPELNNKLYKICENWTGRCVFRQGIFGWNKRVSLLKACILETHP